MYTIEMKITDNMVTWNRQIGKERLWMNACCLAGCSSYSKSDITRNSPQTICTTFIHLTIMCHRATCCKIKVCQQSFDRYFTPWVSVKAQYSSVGVGVLASWLSGVSCLGKEVLFWLLLQTPAGKQGPPWQCCESHKSPQEHSFSFSVT